MLFLVTGATGNVGGEPVFALVDRGHTVRAVTRGSNEQSAWPRGAEPVTGDLDHPDTLISALTGWTGCYCCPATATCRPAGHDHSRRGQAGGAAVGLLGRDR